MRQTSVHGFSSASSQGDTGSCCCCDRNARAPRVGSPAAGADPGAGSVPEKVNQDREPRGTGAGDAVALAPASRRSSAISGTKPARCGPRTRDVNRGSPHPLSGATLVTRVTAGAGFGQIGRGAGGGWWAWQRRPGCARCDPRHHSRSLPVIPAAGQDRARAHVARAAHRRGRPGAPLRPGRPAA